MAVVIIAAGLCAVGTLVLTIWIVKRAVHVVPPSTALVIAGTLRRSGRMTVPRIIRGGRFLQKPLIELVDTLDLRPLEAKVPVQGESGISGQLTAVVKIAGESPLIDQAARLLLGLPRSEISRITEQVLRHHATCLLLARSPEEVLADPESFEERLIEEAEFDLNKLGLVIDTANVALRR